MSEQIINEIKGIGARVDTRFDELKNDFNSRLESAKEQSKNSIDGVDAALKGELRNISEEIVELKKSTGSLVAKSQSIMTPYQTTFKALSENQEKLQSRKGFSFAIEGIHSKAGVMSSSGNLSGTNFVEPTVVPGAFLSPYEAAHVRDVIPSASMGSSDKVAYVYDNGGSGGPAETAEGALKPQTDRDFVKKIVLVSKIANHYDIPEEMLDDNLFMSNAITTIGLEELRAKEDNLFLYKNGAGNEFDGLTVVASGFNDPTGTDMLNKYDVLVAAATQIRKEKHTCNFFLMNPADVADLVLAKGTDNHYLFPEVIANGTPRVLGIPIISHTAISAGEFLAGDRSKARIWDRSAASVRFYDQNEDNAVKNIVTVVIEERTTMTVWYPKAFVYGGFAYSTSSY